MPSFKTNLDLQQNQLVNAVLHNLRDYPPNPVEGQLYYNEGKHTAYLWNGSHWTVLGESSMGYQIKQFSFNIQNPVARTGSLIVRLIEDLTVLRIDSHFDNGFQASFHIEQRSSVNETGITVTDSAIQAVYSGTETTIFSNPLLSANSWLYVNIIDVSGAIGSIEDPGTSGVPDESGTTIPDAGVIGGMLTITITCSTM